MKRVTWFAAGMVSGAAGTIYMAKKVREKAEALKPVNVAKSAAAKAKERAHDLVDAVREGRQAMLDKEAELKALRDEGIDPADVVPVQPGQVIVLRDPSDRRRRQG